MSAIDTALRVIHWAMTDGGKQPPPVGDAHSLEQLSNPPNNLKHELARLTAVTAGRMRLGNPPLGDSTPLSLGTIIIATAIGLRPFPELAGIILEAVPEPGSPIDWIARHGVVQPVLRFFTTPPPVNHDEKNNQKLLRGGAGSPGLLGGGGFLEKSPPVHLISDDFRVLSPLTALLDYPAKGHENMALEAARRLLADRSGRLFLVLHLAQPTDNRRVRDWRQELLMRFNSGSATEQDFVLEVFEAMMIHYQEDAMQQVKAARAIFNDPRAGADEEKLKDAISAANWWQPLWIIKRDNIDILRARHYLDTAYIEGTRLFELSQKLKGGIG
jgi:hypothetical protein